MASLQQLPPDVVERGVAAALDGNALICLAKTCKQFARLVMNGVWLEIATLGCPQLLRHLLNVAWLTQLRAAPWSRPMASITQIGLANAVISTSMYFNKKQVLTPDQLKPLFQQLERELVPLLAPWHAPATVRCTLLTVFSQPANLARGCLRFERWPARP